MTEVRGIDKEQNRREKEFLTVFRQLDPLAQQLLQILAKLLLGNPRLRRDGDASA